MITELETAPDKILISSPLPYKRILIAVDGSETSNLALLEAIKLAKISQSKLCIIHVTPTYPLQGAEIGLDLDRYREIILKNAEALLEVDRDTAQNADVTAETQIIEIRNPVERISEYIVSTAQLWHADLLILGSHGRKGFNRFFLGSVAEETIRIAPIPTLIIRSPNMAQI